MIFVIKEELYNQLAERLCIEKSIHNKRIKSNLVKRLVTINKKKGGSYQAYRLCKMDPDFAKFTGNVDKETREKYIKENEQVLTHQSFLEMDENDKKEFISKVKKCHYQFIDGVYVAYGRKEKTEDREQYKREFFAAKELSKLGYPTYLIPEHIAKYENEVDDKQLADIIHNDTLTDAKQTVSRGGIQDLYAFSRTQGDNVFIEVNNNDISKESAIRAIIGRIKTIKTSENYDGRSFEGKIYLYIKKDKKMYCFNSDENGWITDI